MKVTNNNTHLREPIIVRVSHLQTKQLQTALKTYPDFNGLINTPNNEVYAIIGWVEKE